MPVLQSVWISSITIVNFCCVVLGTAQWKLDVRSVKAINISFFAPPLSFAWCVCFDHNGAYFRLVQRRFFFTQLKLIPEWLSILHSYLYFATTLISNRHVTSLSFFKNPTIFGKAEFFIVLLSWHVLVTNTSCASDFDYVFDESPMWVDRTRGGSRRPNAAHRCVATRLPFDIIYVFPTHNCSYHLVHFL